MKKTIFLSLLGVLALAGGLFVSSPSASAAATWTGTMSTAGSAPASITLVSSADPASSISCQARGRTQEDWGGSGVFPVNNYDCTVNYTQSSASPVPQVTILFGNKSNASGLGPPYFWARTDVTTPLSYADKIGIAPYGNTNTSNWRVISSGQAYSFTGNAQSVLALSAFDFYGGALALRVSYNWTQTLATTTPPITTPPPPPAPTVDLRGPATVNQGQDIHLTWTSTNTTFCDTNFATGSRVLPSGEFYVRTSTITRSPYWANITCTGPGGTADDFVITSIVTPGFTAIPSFYRPPAGSFIGPNGFFHTSTGFNPDNNLIGERPANVGNIPVQIRLDGGGWQTLPTSDNRFFIYESPEALSDTTQHVWELKYEGGLGTSGLRSFLIDKTAPTGSLSASYRPDNPQPAWFYQNGGLMLLNVNPAPTSLTNGKKIIYLSSSLSDNAGGSSLYSAAYQRSINNGAFEQIPTAGALGGGPIADVIPSSFIGPDGKITPCTKIRYQVTALDGVRNQSGAILSNEITVPCVPAPTVTLSATPFSLPFPGGTSTLTWTVSNASSCTASGSWSGSKSTSGGSEPVNITRTTDFTLTCTGTGGSAFSTATVTVGPIIIPPIPPISGLVTDTSNRPIRDVTVRINQDEPARVVITSPDGAFRFSPVQHKVTSGGSFRVGIPVIPAGYTSVRAANSLPENQRPKSAYNNQVLARAVGGEDLSADNTFNFILTPTTPPPPPPPPPPTPEILVRIIDQNGNAISGAFAAASFANDSIAISNQTPTAIFPLNKSVFPYAVTATAPARYVYVSGGTGGVNNVGRTDWQVSGIDCNETTLVSCQSGLRSNNMGQSDIDNSWNNFVQYDAPSDSFTFVFRYTPPIRPPSLSSLLVNGQSSATVTAGDSVNITWSGSDLPIPPNTCVTASNPSLTGWNENRYEGNNSGNSGSRSITTPIVTQSTTFRLGLSCGENSEANIEPESSKAPTLTINPRQIVEPTCADSAALNFGGPLPCIPRPEEVVGLGAPISGSILEELSNGSTRPLTDYTGVSVMINSRSFPVASSNFSIPYNSHLVNYGGAFRVSISISSSRYSGYRIKAVNALPPPPPQKIAYSNQFLGLATGSPDLPTDDSFVFILIPPSAPGASLSCSVNTPSTGSNYVPANGTLRVNAGTTVTFRVSVNNYSGSISSYNWRSTDGLNEYSGTSPTYVWNASGSGRQGFNVSPVAGGSAVTQGSCLVNVPVSTTVTVYDPITDTTGTGTGDDTGTGAGTGQTQSYDAVVTVYEHLSDGSNLRWDLVASHPSLTAVIGGEWYDITNGSAVAPVSGAYDVSLLSVPSGYTIISPASGFYSNQTADQNRSFDFILQSSSLLPVNPPPACVGANCGLPSEENPPPGGFTCTFGGQTYSSGDWRQTTDNLDLNCQLEWCDSGSWVPSACDDYPPYGEYIDNQPLLPSVSCSDGPTTAKNIILGASLPTSDLGSCVGGTAEVIGPSGNLLTILNDRFSPRVSGQYYLRSGSAQTSPRQINVFTPEVQETAP